MKISTRSASQNSAPNYIVHGSDSGTDFEDLDDDSNLSNKRSSRKRKRQPDVGSPELRKLPRRRTTRNSAQRDSLSDEHVHAPDESEESSPDPTSGRVVLKFNVKKSTERTTRHPEIGPRSASDIAMVDATPADRETLSELFAEDSGPEIEDSKDVDYKGPRRRVSLQSGKVDIEAAAEQSPEKPPRRLRRRPQIKTPVARSKGSDGEDYDPSVQSAEDSPMSSEEGMTPDVDNLDDFVEDDETRSRARRRRLSRRTRPARRVTRARVVTSDDGTEDELQAELEDLRAPEKQVRSRQLRDRTNRPDYAIPPPLADQMFTEPVSRKRGSPSRRFRSLYPDYSSLGLGLSNNAHQTFGNFGPPAGLPDESDSSDDENQVTSAEARVLGSSLVAPLTRADPASGGGPANMGKVKGANMADADPIAIDQEVNFESIGGLGDHINQLKEMVSLPLLYPEIFQRFHISPPRGVLFHGPPGTGKTLMARALAASCSSESRKISFYMRKGADCLSKWVGEAERQLRLLFEEAKNNQPSIIFFDEIDGLAPVRSAKQDQIHASIVSTLLALMDGMDNRGQIVVIGATNRPDSVDPALRRPGRFDREFYFPLPELDARQHILTIHTAKWNPPLSAAFITELAKQTKGYGGADLRALCTEAALFAVQRRYPQIYASSEKLVIDPSSIKTTPKDFMMAIKKILPSSARSTISQASALPAHLRPLLDGPFLAARNTIDEMLPRSKKNHTALDDSIYVADEDSTFEAENLRQMLETLRTYKPRLLICGEEGSGHQYVGSAILQHLEGFHVRTIDLAAIFGDASSTTEAVLIQAFAEVRKHPPAAIYMPSIDLWFESASPTLLLTFKSLLSSIGKNEQFAIIGTANSAEELLSPRLKDIFGQTDENIITIIPPSDTDRFKFFDFVVSLIRKAPSDLPDGTQKRKRVLETLPVAPAPPPRILSKAERKAIELKDKKTKLLLKAKLGLLMDLIRTKYKRFRKPAIEEKDIAHLLDEPGPVGDLADAEFEKTEDGMILQKSNGKKYYNMDIDLIDQRLWRSLYLTPKQFQNDIAQIVHDAEQVEGDRERGLKAQELLTTVQLHLEDMFDTSFLDECKRMAVREVTRYEEHVENQNKVAKTAAIASAQVMTDVQITTGDENLAGQLQHSTVVHSIDQIMESSGVNGVNHLLTNDERATQGNRVTSCELAVSEQLSAAQPAWLPDRMPAPVKGKPAKGLPNGITTTANHPIRDLDLGLPSGMNGHNNGLDRMSVDAMLSSDVPRDNNLTTNGVVPETQEEVFWHPPLTLDEDKLMQSQAEWVDLTAGFSVEELEEVHSAAIDAVWSARSDWNRNRVLDTVCLAIERKANRLSSRALTSSAT